MILIVDAADTVSVAAVEVTLPEALVTTTLYWLLFIVTVTALNVSVAVVTAGEISVNVVPPLVLTCHA